MHGLVYYMYIVQYSTVYNIYDTCKIFIGLIVGGWLEVLFAGRKNYMNAAQILSKAVVNIAYNDNATHLLDSDNCTRISTVFSHFSYI